jgi:glutamate synthase domain-containing protein 3
VHELLERHVKYTGSPRAQALLDRWEDELRHWWRVAPKAEIAALQGAAEGTAAAGGGA